MNTAMLVKCIFVDLDDTLIHTMSYNDAARKNIMCEFRESSGGITQLRPYAREFLGFCSRHAPTFIFSAGSPEWVIENVYGFGLNKYVKDAFSSKTAQPHTMPHIARSENFVLVEDRPFEDGIVQKKLKILLGHRHLNEGDRRYVQMVSKFGGSPASNALRELARNPSWMISKEKRATNRQDRLKVTPRSRWVAIPGRAIVPIPDFSESAAATPRHAPIFFHSPSTEK